MTDYQVNCIMLIDDNQDDNFYHQRVIKKNGVTNNVLTKSSATDALEYLKSKKDDVSLHPDVIFLDINMPGMNGWEFMEEYSRLDKNLQSKTVVIMLTTSDNPDDIARSKKYEQMADFRTKPLTKDMLYSILDNIRHK